MRCLSSVFALIEPAVIARRSQSAQELGYDTSYLVDITQHPAPVCQSVYYAAGVLGMQVPPRSRTRTIRAASRSCSRTSQPWCSGQTALRQDVPLQPAAFIAGQQLTYLRPGLYLRHLLASGTILKAWLFAAIKLSSPQFPVSPELEGAVTEAMQALEAGVTGQARDHLTRVVAKLLTSGAALDLKRWVRGVDLTADRVGFMLSHDLETATQIIKGIRREHQLRGYRRAPKRARAVQCEQPVLPPAAAAGNCSRFLVGLDGSALPSDVGDGMKFKCARAPLARQP